MSSPATFSAYGKYIDLQSYTDAAPAASGSVYLSGSSGSERMYMNVGLKAPRLDINSSTEITSVLDEDNMSSDSATALATQQSIKAYVDAQVTAQDLDFQGDSGGALSIDLDSETLTIAGTANEIETSGAGNTLTIGLPTNVTVGGSMTAGSSFVIGSADLDETDMEKLDGITDGTVAANKAVVVDGNKDASGFRDVTATGDITAGSEFVIGSAALDESDMEKLDGITDGTAAANKALVLDASKNIGTINQVTTTYFTASYAYIDELDVNTINSITTTESTLEVVDKLIVAASGSSAAGSDAGGLQIGDDVASVLYDHGNTALDFNVAGATRVRLETGALVPETDDDCDLGASGNEFKDLYLDGVAYIDDLRADALGAALDCDSNAMTNVNIDSGDIDGVTIGANSKGDGTFGTLKADDLGKNLDAAGFAIQNASTLTVATIEPSASAFSLDLGVCSDENASISISDNAANAFEIKEGSSGYMVFTTTNGSEFIQAKQDMSFEKGMTLGESSNPDGKISIVGDKMVLSGSSLHLSGAVSTDDAADFNGGVTMNTAKVEDLTDGRVVLAGSGGELEDSGNLTFDGSTLAVTGDVTVSNGLDVVGGGLAANSLKVDDLTDGRVLLAGASGEVEDSGNLTFDGSTLALTGDLTATNGVEITGGGLEVAAGGFLVSAGGAEVTGSVTVDGDITLPSDHDMKARSFVTYSDAALKTNVETIENPMTLIQGLRGVSYNTKADGAREYGFIAQEVNSIVPEVVHAAGDVMGIDYTRLTSLLVEAVKSQQVEIEALKNKLDK